MGVNCDELVSPLSNRQAQKGIVICEGERPNRNGVGQTQDGKGKSAMEVFDLDKDDDESNWGLIEQNDGGELF